MHACKSYIATLLVLVSPAALASVDFNPRSVHAQSLANSSNWSCSTIVDRTPGIAHRPEQDSPDGPASFAAIEEDEDAPDELLEFSYLLNSLPLPPASNATRTSDSRSPTSWESRLRSISLRC